VYCALCEGILSTVHCVRVYCVLCEGILYTVHCVRAYCVRQYNSTFFDVVCISWILKC